MRNADDLSYLFLAKRQQRDKAYNTVLGILDGIQADGEVVQREIAELHDWAIGNTQLKADRPFREVSAAVLRAVADGQLTQDEIEDLQFICRNALTTSDYFNDVTRELQHLQGMLHGLLADRKIVHGELNELVNWMDANQHLRGLFPMTEIESVVMSVLTDGTISNDEHEYLRQFFEQFIQPSPNYVAQRLKEGYKPMTFSGICAIDPLIEFAGRSFCFTGIAKSHTRIQLSEIVETRRGVVRTGVAEDLDYLVVCENGNPCWAFSCYGRKVEKAMAYRKAGSRVLLLKEIDFLDAGRE